MTGFYCSLWPELCTITSKPISIFIDDYHGVDSLAYNYLKKQPRPDFILFPTLPAANHDTSDIFRAESLLRNFPNSSFEPYVFHYLVSEYFQKARLEAIYGKNQDKVLQYLRFSKKYALKVLSLGDEGMKAKTNGIYEGYLETLRAVFYPIIPPEKLEEEFILPTKN